MKQQVTNFIEKINIVLISIFLILCPIFLGIYRSVYIDIYLLCLLFFAIIYACLFILKKYKLNKRYILYFLFALTFAIPIILGIGEYKIEAIKNLFLILLIIVFVMNIIDTFKEKKELLFNIIIISTVLTSIVSMIGIFYPTLLDKLYISYGFSDFYVTSVYRLYGTFQYPNLLAVFNLIGIILCFSHLDKKRYNIALYLNLLTLFLTISKSIILFCIPVFIILLKINKKSFYSILSVLVPLIYNITVFRNCYVNNDTVSLVLITTVLILVYLFTINFSKKHFKISLTIILSILVIGILFPNSSLYIKKSTNPIILTDFMNLPKNNIYKLTFDIEETDLDGQIVVKKLVLEDNMLNSYIVGFTDLSVDNNIYFKTVENSEYYIVELQNTGKDFKLKQLILADENEAVEVSINYYLYPYSYIKMFEQIKYDVGSLAGRKAIYQDCFKMIKSSPFKGHGYQYFKYYTDTNLPIHSAIEEHSYILRLGVENGIINMIMWLIIMISMAIRMIRNFDKEHLPIVLIVALILFSSLYDFTLSFQFFLILLFIFDMLLNRNESKDILCICSAGGHLTAMMKLKNIINKHNSILITEKTVLSKNIEDFNVKYVLYCTKYYLFHYLCVLPINIILNIYYFIYYNPKVVLTTGAHTGVFMCYLAKIFKRKVIFIEVFDRYKTLTMSGRFVYKIADVFIVQQKQLQNEYPKSIYIGGMF